MSDFKVPYTQILDIIPHPDADRLEIAVVYGFNVVVAKDHYKVGDKIVYVPPDSVLPQDLEGKVFPPGSKIKLDKHRVRQIRIRKYPSQGLILSKEIVSGFVDLSAVPLEKDLSSSLGISKYEPPLQMRPSLQTPPRNPILRFLNKTFGIRVGGRGRKRRGHPRFHTYNGLTNIKWVPNVFGPDDDVVVQEKLHGTNARAGILPSQNLFKRIVGKPDSVYGSNEVQKGLMFDRGGYYSTDVWFDAFSKIGVFEKIRRGEIVYGEIVGPRIQKNYDYGHSSPTFVLFDVKIFKPDGSCFWLNPEDAEKYAKIRGFPFVPVLYSGKFDRDLVYGLTRGPSVYHPAQKVREGVVVKHARNYNGLSGGKAAVKWISEDYLDDKNNTDFH